MSENDKKKINVEPQRGMRDFYPEDMRIRNWIFDTFRECAELSGFEQYDACVVEGQELFIRKAGEEVVDQIYGFKDKSDRELALRPEMTPSFARLIISKGRALLLPAKWFGIFQCFRYERTVRGRKREHYQWNLDIAGEESISAEAEVLQTALMAIKRFGLTSDVVKIRVGSRSLIYELIEAMGFDMNHFMDACMVLDKRGKVEDEVLKELLDQKGVLAKDIEILFKVLEINSIEKAKSILSEGSKALSDIEKLFRILETAGYGDYVVFDVAVIRGLAYYTGIVFEAFDVKGRHRAIFGGGRYDKLIESLGGESTPCVGMGFGDVVIYELLKDENLLPESKSYIDLHVAYMDDEAEELCVHTASQCRQNGLRTSLMLQCAKPKKIFAFADKIKSKYVLMVGSRELSEKKVNIKCLLSGEQEQVAVENVVSYLKGKLFS